MKEGKKEEDININIEILPKILKDILDDTRKRKPEDSVDYHSCKVHVAAPGG